MRQAIETHYLGSTNFRGGRVKAQADAGSVTVEWDHALNMELNHERAAEALAKKFGWLDNGSYLMGGSLKGRGYCFIVMAPGDRS